MFPRSVTSCLKSQNLAKTIFSGWKLYRKTSKSCGNHFFEMSCFHIYLSWLCATFVMLEPLWRPFAYVASPPPIAGAWAYLFHPEYYIPSFKCMISATAIGTPWHILFQPEAHRPTFCHLLYFHGRNDTRWYDPVSFRKYLTRLRLEHLHAAVSHFFWSITNFRKYFGGDHFILIRLRITRRNTRLIYSVRIQI